MHLVPNPACPIAALAQVWPKLAQKLAQDSTGDAALSVVTTAVQLPQISKSIAVHCEKAAQRVGGAGDDNRLQVHSKLSAVPLTWEQLEDAVCVHLLSSDTPAAVHEWPNDWQN